jgi:hypothetical protein
LIAPGRSRTVGAGTNADPAQMRMRDRGREERQAGPAMRTATIAAPPPFLFGARC